VLPQYQTTIDSKNVRQINYPLQESGLRDLSFNKLL